MACQDGMANIVNDVPGMRNSLNRQLRLAGCSGCAVTVHGTARTWACSVVVNVYLAYNGAV